MADTAVAAPPVKAVIFDVDGTLYRQRPLRRAMAVRLLRAHLLHPLRGWRTARVLSAYRRAQEQLRADGTLGDLAETQLRWAAARTGIDRDTVARWVERWMDEEPVAIVARYGRPGLHDALATLRSRGVGLGVLSDYQADAKLRALGVAEMFDVVLCAQQTDIGVFKPHPRGLEVALDRLGVGADEALYVGDRVDVDASTAAAARMRCAILVDPTGRGDSDAAYQRITSLQQLTDCLETP